MDGHVRQTDGAQPYGKGATKRLYSGAVEIDSIVIRCGEIPGNALEVTITVKIATGYYAMSGTSQKNSKIQKFKDSTVEKKNISLVQLTNAAISLLN